MSELKEFVVMQISLHLGASGVSLKKGDVIMSDGLSKVVVDGNTINVPSFRGAVKGGWVVPADEVDSGVQTRTRTHKAEITRTEKATEVEVPTPKKVKIMVQEDEEFVSVRPKNTSNKLQSRDAEEDENKGVVVKKVAIPSNFPPVAIDGEDKRILRELETEEVVEVDQSPRVKGASSRNGNLREVVEDSEVAGRFVNRKTGKVEEVEQGDRTPPAKMETTNEEKEPLSEAEIRGLKFEVVSMLYRDLEYKYKDPWRSRAKSIVAYYNRTNDRTMLELMMSIETQSVRGLVESGTKDRKV
jgi:hypothetical protein